MAAPEISRRELRTQRRRRNRRRPLLWTLLAVGAVLLACAAWVGVRGWIAKGELESAQSLITELRAQASDFQFAAALETMDQIERRTDAAVDLTSDPIWRAAEYLPFLGKNLTVVRELAVIADDVVDGVAAPLMDVAQSFDPAALVPKDGAIDLTPLESAIPAVIAADGEAQRVWSAVSAIDAEGTIGPVIAAREKVARLLGEVTPLLATAADVLPLIPPALGSEGPRTYAVMFQNNAEARALGGTALSFAVVQVDEGRIQLVDSFPAGFGTFPKFAESVLPLPDGAAQVYPGGVYGTYIPNVTLRPSFVTAAELTQEMWIRTFGYPLDGVASIDPVALSYIMGATEGVPLSSGDVLTATTTVPLLLNELYLRYNTGDPFEDNRMQDVIYGEAVAATFSALVGGNLEPKPFVAALLRAFDERRLLVWSAKAEEQERLADVDLDRGLPVSDETHDVVGVYFQDNVGSKLNYYLRQTIDLAQGACTPDGPQNYRVTAGLTSTLDPATIPSLSPSVVGSYQREGLEPGYQRMIAYVYAPPGSAITSLTVDGIPVAVEPLHDAEYPVARVIVMVAPGATVQIAVDILAAQVGERALEVESTPLVTATTITRSALDCASLPTG